MSLNVDAEPEIGHYKPVNTTYPSEVKSTRSFTNNDRTYEDSQLLQKNVSEVIMKNRSLVVDFLVIIFGIGTWVGVNGIFLQLPLLVEKSPEYWSLPSYLSFVVQIGNLGPLTYTLLQKISKDSINESIVIYLLLAIGTLSAILAAFFYDRTATIGGKEYSVALFVFTFCFALTACTSSVLFMPYMGRFKEIYLVTYLFGEGLSGLIPSVVAIIQGVGSSNQCNTNNTDMGKVSEKSTLATPLFGTMEFFIIIFALMLCSFIAFTLLDHLKLAKKQYANVTVTTGNSYVYKQDNNNVGVVEQLPQLSASQFKFILVLFGLVSFVANGMFTSIQSYSTMPYGSQVYHLTATLSLIANPVACSLAVFLPHNSLKSIILLTSVVAVCTIYVFVTAIMSPYPPLVGSSWGSAIVICLWTLLIAVVSYVKLSITSVMRAQGGKSLVLTGAISLVGSAVGSMLIFVLINYTSIFKALNEDCD